jgi:hypothetical protein
MCIQNKQLDWNATTWQDDLEWYGPGSDVSPPPLALALPPFPSAPSSPADPTTTPTRWCGSRLCVSPRAP